MKLTLRQQLTQFAHVLDGRLFPVLQEEVGELDDTARRLIATLELVPLARFVPSSRGWIGRPSKDRMAIASAFIAKAVYGFSTTRQVLERLQQDCQLRRLCGWNTARNLPHESTFSRAFAEFATMELPQFVHDALIAATQKDRLVGHIARDSTAIAARERLPRPTAKQEKRAEEKRKRRGGRTGKRGAHKRYKGGKAPRPCRENTRLHKQRSMKLDQMLAELPPAECSIGVKRSNDGNQQYWRGYKLHLDVAEGQIPITAMLTSATLHDSQAAIPLATMTARRVTNLYDVMDSAYHAAEILEHSRELGHVPIVRAPKRRKDVLFGPKGVWEAEQFTWAEEERFRERTSVERVFARLKDEFGAASIRVRGAKKVMAHLMFSVLALTSDQILRLVK
jgi:hypothetical protein